MFKSLTSILNKRDNEKTDNTDRNTGVSELTLLNDFNEESDRNVRAVDSDMSSAISNCFEELSSVYNDFGDSFDNNASVKTNGSIGENKRMHINGHNRKHNIVLSTQIQSLHCLFTWKSVSQNKRDIITYIKNKYGDKNLDISIPEFTFAR